MQGPPTSGHCPGSTNSSQGIKAAGAAAVIPATPAPAAASRDEITRLQSLLRLEERGGAPANSAAPGLVRLQLEEAEDHLDQQQRVAAAIMAAGNVVLGLATTGYRPGLPAASDTCTRRVATASALVAAPDPGRPVTAALVPAATVLCEAAAAIGHVALLTDPDGVVRRAAPELMTEAGAMPSSALAAIRQAGDKPRRNGDLARFYSSAAGTTGFAVVPAADILAGRAAGVLRDRYVVIGSAEAGATDRVRTPLDDSAGTAALIATDLANYLAGDQIARPGWALWLEIALALLLAVGAVLSGRLSLPVAAGAAVAGMLVLLLAEYLLVAVAGTWIHLAGLALFCLTGVAILQFAVQLSRRDQSAAANSSTARGIGAAGQARNWISASPCSGSRRRPTVPRPSSTNLPWNTARSGTTPGPSGSSAILLPAIPAIGTLPPSWKSCQARGAPSRRRRHPATATPPPAPGQPPFPRQADTRPLDLERVVGAWRDGHRLPGQGPHYQPAGGDEDPAARRGVCRQRPGYRPLALSREAESAGRLDRPYIISIRDAGKGNHVTYLAMEYSKASRSGHYAQRAGCCLPGWSSS